MTAFRFIHTADLHLDTPFKGLSGIPTHISEQIRKSTLAAFEQIVQYCIDYKVDFLLIAGDVYDLQDRSLRAQIMFFKQLERLSSLRIPVYIIHGNHDALDQVKSTFQLPEHTYIFSGDRVEAVSYYMENREVARIYGRSYPTKAFYENIVKEYMVNPGDNLFHIALLHTNVDGDPNHDSYAPSTLQELKQADIDYWALGHIHKGEILFPDAPYVVYSGNPQGRHINETGMKGCVMVDVEEQVIRSVDWLPTSQIVWERLKVDISGLSSMQEILNHILNEIDRYKETIHVPLILRIELLGNSILPMDLRHNFTEMTEAINEVYSNQEQWVWVESIRSNIKTVYTPEELEKREGFLSEYLKQLQQFKQEMNQDQLLKEMAGEMSQHRGARKYFPQLSAEDIDEIFDTTVHLAAKFFLEGEES